MTSLLKYLLPLVLLLAAGCSSLPDDLEPVPEPEAVMVPVGLYVQVTDASDGSRATPEGNYDGGQGYENYIDLATDNPDISVLLYDNSDHILMSVDNAVVSTYADYGTSKTYLLKFEVTEEFCLTKLNGPFKVVLMANFRHLYPITYRLSELSFAATGRPLPSALATPDVGLDSRIMLYGVNRFNGYTFDPGTLNMLGSLHLLRALAKIEVYDADTTDSPIASISLTRHNTRFEPIPRGVTSQDDYVKGNYDDDYTLTPSTGTASDPYAYESDEPIDVLSTVGSDGKKHFIIYVPEYANLDADGNKRPTAERARLKVTFESQGTAYINFMDYSDANYGRHFNIMRNWWYRFCVNHGAQKPEIKVDVLPYLGVSLTPEYGWEDLIPRPKI